MVDKLRRRTSARRLPRFGATAVRSRSAKETSRESARADGKIPRRRSRPSRRGEHRLDQESLGIGFIARRAFQLPCGAENLPDLLHESHVDAWEPTWARLFAGRQASVALDCDGAGRHAAARIAADLKAAGVRGSIVDLVRGRTDGYDLTEWLAERENLGAQELRRALGMPGTRPRARVRAAGR